MDDYQKQARALNNAGIHVFIEGNHDLTTEQVARVLECLADNERPQLHLQVLYMELVDEITAA